jgi:hypothetical protein
MKTSSCRECGQPIIWAHKPDGDFHPPLEVRGVYEYVIINDIVYCEMTYQYHECAKEDVAKYTEYQADQRKLKQGMINANDAWRLCIDFACQKCGADAGQKCENLSDRNRATGPIRKTKWPHGERMTDANVLERWEAGQ